MSGIFKPDIDKPEPVKEVELKQVQARGRVGRTILGGAAAKKNQVQTQKKTILGG
jgi:hypothetical protein